MLVKQIEQKEIGDIKLEFLNCANCGRPLSKLKLIQGELILEILCHNCHFYNTVYLKKNP